MKAIVVHEYGGPEVLKYEEYPDPVPGTGEVLVRVAASSVNPIDYKRRAGLTKDFYPLKFPGLTTQRSSKGSQWRRRVHGEDPASALNLCCEQ
jgi:hypothetical protein